MKTFQEFQQEVGVFAEDMTKDIPSKFIYFVYRAGKVVYKGDDLPDEYNKAKSGYVVEKFDEGKESRESRKLERDRRNRLAYDNWTAALRSEYDFLNDTQYNALFNKCQVEKYSYDEYDWRMHDTVELIREMGFDV